MKSFLKKILVGILGSQIRRLRNEKNFKIIGVAGSIGKTSTKIAIAKVLESEKRVRYQEGNYNDIISVPLVFFGHQMPGLWNIFAWIKIIFLNEIQIFFSYPFDFVVVEIGTDGPGQIAEFRKYLHLDIAVLTAVTPEHMEFFKTLEAVAEEEWSVSFWSDLVFANKDLCQIIPENINRRKIIFYGKDFGAIYKIENVSRLKDGFNFEISYKGAKVVNLFYPAVSEIELYSICAAVALGRHSSLSIQGVKKSVERIKSFSGRMQKLKGIKNAILIDDTYNASPEAVKAAIQALYSYPETQKIAILGMMNELGESSKEEHEKIGELCDPKLLDFVVTIGLDANKYLAEKARTNGCVVYQAKNSAEAGEIVKSKIKDGAVVLVKGSQNGVFAEESLKPLLKNPNDVSKLVRQDKVWMKKKTASG